MPGPLRVATRGSALARWQAGRVADLLGVDAELVVVTTSGDRRTDVPIHAMGGTGVFVKEVEEALLDGRADVAVHSAKDLPSDLPDGLVLAAVPERADPRDVLVGRSLADLPTGGRVGTGSVRRRAQLAHERPDLTFGELRGNVPTRVSRVGELDAVVVALAALERLGLRDRVAEVLPTAVMLPQVGQGALAVEARSEDERVLELVARADHGPSRVAVTAERAFLAELGGGCALPCGALATVAGGEVSIEVLLASLDGRLALRARAAGEDPALVGREAARVLVEEHGGRLLLEGAG
ncbi:MAG: hydroxymethylbilane synthase [Acidimicrobiia bacterium]|nr:hydroxymethylbilane synthase [Acidimicrobiia bacterium]